MSKQSPNPRAAQFFEFEDKPVPRAARKRRRKKQSRNKTNPNAAKFFVFEDDQSDGFGFEIARLYLGE